jgi:cell division protein FtsQ
MKLRPALSRGGKRAGQPRPRVVPMWRNGRALAAVCAIFFATLCGVVWLSWQAGIPQRAAADAAYSLIECSAKLGFVVRDVFVVGRSATPKATLLNALAVSRGTPILAVDLEAARKRIQTLPWVRHATVRRVLPDTVVVEIIERRPLAIWQHEKKFALIDEEGQVILRNDVGAFSYLMIVVGEDAASEASVLVQMLATEPDLMERVKAAVRVGGRRWNVHFAQGIDVKLPADDPAGAWRRLGEYQRRYGVLDKGIRILDLRLSDRLMIVPAPPAVEDNPIGGDA